MHHFTKATAQPKRPMVEYIASVAHFKGVVVYVRNGQQIASFPAWLNQGVIPTAATARKLCA